MNKDSAAARGIRTAIQAAIAFVIGLAVVVWQVPGVPQVVISYTTQNIAGLATSFGVSAGLVSFVWNFFRKDVPNI